MPLGTEFKLTKDQSPKTVKVEEKMKIIPYASVVGSLIYAMICVRLDISHAVGVVSRFMSNHGEELALKVVKWIMRYLQNSLNVGLCFTKKSVELIGYRDSDLGGDLDISKSTSRCISYIWGAVVS